VRDLNVATRLNCVATSSALRRSATSRSNFQEKQIIRGGRYREPGNFPPRHGNNDTAPPKTQPTAAGSHVVPAPYHPVEGDWSDGVAAATKCEAGQYFDPAGLQCLACATGSSVTTAQLGCECAAGTYRLAGSGTSPYSSCASCAAVGSAVTWDNTTCMACDNTTNATLVAATGDCACASATAVLAELDSTGSGLP